MKKITMLFIFALIFFVASQNVSHATEKNSFTNKKINVVVTTFPIYDFTREIIGSTPSNINLEIIIDNGIDLHNFQPSTKDIATISNADVFIYNGGESDVWVKKVLTQTMNKNMKIINLMASLGDKVKEELIVDGMKKHEHEHEHEHGHEHEHECEHGHDKHKHEEHEHNSHKHDKHYAEHDSHDSIIYDEHVWLSLRNAIYICNTLSTELQAIDNTNASQYETNSQAYINKLTALDTKYDALFKNISKKTALFADRFPFRYLMDDYSITYFAAFPGCSAETEASFETVIFLSNKINELNLQKILIVDNSTNNIANAIIQSSNNKNADILSLNSMQTVTVKELAEGISYFKIMKKNLEILKEALE